MLNKLLHGWTGGRILPVCFLALSAMAMARAQTARAQTGSDPVQDALLHRLRELCVENPSLRGVYVQNAAPSKKGVGTLVVDGIVDNKEQAKLLAAEGKKAIAEIAAWKERYPGGVQMGTVKV